MTVATLVRAPRVQHAPTAPLALDVPRETNAYAVGALVLGMVGGVVLAVPTAVVALRQVSRTGQAGRAMAVIGLVLSGLWVWMLTALIVVGSVFTVDRDAHGAVTDGGRILSTDLRVGDCFQGVRATGTVGFVHVVRCAQGHDAEVFAVAALPDGSWPGRAAVRASALRLCRARTATLPDAIRRDPSLDLYVLHPPRADWDDGGRRVVCIAASEQPRTGSIRG